MKQKRKSGRKLLSFLLTLALVLGLMPGMSLTALAWDGDPYASLVNTITVVKFDSKDWYLIEDNSTAVDAGTVTLLSKECVAASMYDSNGQSNTYSGSTVETAVNNYYTNSISDNVKSAIVDSKMFLLTTDQANTIDQVNSEVLKCNKASGADDNVWWLCSPGDGDFFAACVVVDDTYVEDLGYYVANTLGVRPALKLDLSKVVFDSTSNTFSVACGNVDVTGISLTPLAKQTINVGEKVSFTASVSPDNATDKKVKWRVGGNDASAVKLYSDEACTTEVGADATDKLTVYAKGESAGSALVAATSNADSTKSVTCDVTVTVGKANAVAATVTANSRTYDGTEKPLVTVTGEATGGEMQYALGTASEATQPYTTSIPTATDAGTYYVWYKAVGDAIHSDSNPAVVTIIISEETPVEPEIKEGDIEAKKEGSAHDDEKISIDNDLTEIREIVSGEASVDDSDTVRLILNTNSVDENADENKEAVDSIKSMIEADNLNIGSFLDITLSFIVEDANGTEKSSGQLAELNGRSLSVRFPIPSKLQASGRLFRIFRFHGGKAEEVGSGRGDAVVLSLDKFSIYAIAYEDGAAPEETKESEKKVVKPHTHTYAWDKVEATESQDGELRYQCTECYDILVRVPLSAYYVFNANTVDKINKAKQGETVKITTDRWISFHKMVFDALAARPDVSLEVSFLDGEYKGNRVSFTIPAGADNSDLFTENNFAGFRYLGNKYGLTAEEN